MKNAKTQEMKNEVETFPVHQFIRKANKARESKEIFTDKQYSFLLDYYIKENWDDLTYDDLNNLYVSIGDKFDLNIDTQIGLQYGHEETYYESDKLKEDLEVLKNITDQEILDKFYTEKYEENFVIDFVRSLLEDYYIHWIEYKLGIYS